MFTQSTYLDNNTHFDLNSDESIPLKYPLYSAIIPGLGQYQLYKDTKISNTPPTVIPGTPLQQMWTILNFHEQSNVEIMQNLEKEILYCVFLF